MSSFWKKLIIRNDATIIDCIRIINEEYANIREKPEQPPRSIPMPTIEEDSIFVNYQPIDLIPSPKPPTANDIIPTSTSDPNVTITIFRPRKPTSIRPLYRLPSNRKPKKIEPLGFMKKKEVEEERKKIE